MRLTPSDAPASHALPRSTRPGPLIMGVVNVTPDSFSDGGQFGDGAAAIDHGRRLIDSGADLLDVGGESTRPGSLPVTALEQWARIGKVVAELSRSSVPVSVDTRSAEVAHRALEAGAAIVNDVSSGSDPELLPAVARSGATVILMHMQGTPRTMQAAPHYVNVVEDVLAQLERDRARALAAGVAPERVWLDPGIGFGKSLEHNLEILRSLAHFVATGATIVLGTSRKSFIDGCSKSTAQQRLAGSLASLVPAFHAGVHVVRVHDVFETRQFFDLLAQVGGPPA